jgi:uncharacterized damage-inducible protein DinB
MSETARIRNQFQRAFDGEAWHGPSVLALLDGVTAEQAAAHPIPGAHSIWELTLHIAAWEDACRRRLEGDPAQLSDDENFPPITETNPAAWESAKGKLIDVHRRLLDAISAIDDARLDQPIIDSAEIPFSSAYVTLHGGVQHSLYHAGQIAVLKKAIGSFGSVAS